MSSTACKLPDLAEVKEVGFDLKSWFEQSWALLDWIHS